MLVEEGRAGLAEGEGGTAPEGRDGEEEGSRHEEEEAENEEEGEEQWRRTISPGAPTAPGCTFSWGRLLQDQHQRLIPRPEEGPGLL